MPVLDPELLPLFLTCNRCAVVTCGAFKSITDGYVTFPHLMVIVRPLLLICQLEVLSCDAAVSFQ